MGKIVEKILSGTLTDEQKQAIGFVLPNAQNVFQWQQKMKEEKATTDAFEQYKRDIVPTDVSDTDKARAGMGFGIVMKLLGGVPGPVAGVAGNEIGKSLPDRINPDLQTAILKYLGAMRNPASLASVYGTNADESVRQAQVGNYNAQAGYHTANMDKVLQELGQLKKDSPFISSKARREGTDVIPGLGAVDYSQMVKDATGIEMPALVAKEPPKPPTVRPFSYGSGLVDSTGKVIREAVKTPASGESTAVERLAFDKGKWSEEKTLKAEEVETKRADAMFASIMKEGVNAGNVNRVNIALKTINPVRIQQGLPPLKVQANGNGIRRATYELVEDTAGGQQAKQGLVLTKGKKYRDAQGNVKTYMGTDASGKNLWR